MHGHTPSLALPRSLVACSSLFKLITIVDPSQTVVHPLPMMPVPPPPDGVTAATIASLGTQQAPAHSILSSPSTLLLPAPPASSLSGGAMPAASPVVTPRTGYKMTYYKRHLPSVCIAFSSQEGEQC